MITLTARAGALLQRLPTPHADSRPLRLMTESGVFAIGTSSPSPDDDVLCHAGAPVLYLSAAAATALAGCTLTTRELPAGPALAIITPTVLRHGRGRTMNGRSRRVPAVAPLTPGQRATVQARVRQLVTDDQAGGVSAEDRTYCDACQQARPACGSRQDGRYLLCNTCGLEYAVAGVRGLALSAGQFVREKVFGEAAAYALPVGEEDEPPRNDTPLRLRLPPAARGRSPIGPSSGTLGTTARPVIRFVRPPRH
jgi:hypothetical protein